MNKLIRTCTSTRVSSLLKGISYCARRGLKRDVSQPTHYSHPELLNENEIFPGISKTDLSDRRRRLMEEIGKSHSGMTNTNHIVIIPAATLRYMSHDIFYRFHQNNDFLYLTGFQEPDAVLIMESNGTSKLPNHKSILYVTPRNPIKENWEGPIMGPEDAVDFLGVDEAYDLNNLAEHLEKKYSKGNYSVWYYKSGEIPRTVGYAVDVTVSEYLLEAPGACISSVHSPVHCLQHIRAFKSDAEISLMRRAGQIAADSFRKTMSITQGNMYEYQLEAYFEYHCRSQGAQRVSFVPVVAGGHRGCSLHYTTNEQRLKNGELVLMDAGAEYFGYVSDITRTWPVSGSFNEYQRDLYQAVLRIKDACIECCQVGITLNYLHALSKEMLARELKNLGIIPTNLEGPGLASVINSLYPHDLGHYLGMDVHDCSLITNNVQLQPGMVITIEPGVYIKRGFPIKDPIKAKGYQGIAIRIEDNVLITNEGPIILNSGTPESIDEITELINTKQ